MVVLNEATMLQNVRERFGRDRIYTRAGLMLVAVNPGRLFAELYTDSVKGRSKDSDLHDVKREPHLYDVAEQAYRQLLAEKKSQSIIISGESGAGKTESIKYSMNYLVWRAPSVESSSTGAAMAPAAAEAGGQLTTRIHAEQPAVGGLGKRQDAAQPQLVPIWKVHHAAVYAGRRDRWRAGTRSGKSRRQRSSSTLQPSPAFSHPPFFPLAPTQLHTFLLEKSRVTNADAENERSYHVLYQLVAGSPLTAGKGCEHFRMLTQSGTTTIPGRDDKEEFNKLQIALGWFGMDPAVQKGLWEVLLGALHLGNVTFDGPADEPAVITPATEPDLAHAERLLGIAGLRSNLIEKEITAGGSETMTLQLKPLMAMHARDALVKQLYVTSLRPHRSHCERLVEGRRQVLQQHYRPLGCVRLRILQEEQLRAALHKLRQREVALVLHGASL